MTSTERFDLTVADWLRDDARHRVPDHLAEALALTSRTRQRPWWSSPERWLRLDTTFSGRTPSMRPAWLALIVLAVLVAIVAIAVVGSRARPLPAPFGVAADGQIAFWAGDDILVSEADGTNVHPLISGPTQDFAPLYSRDGTHIAFWRASTPHEATLMVASADGSEIRPVRQEPLTDADWFEWSPDSRSLLVVHTAGGVRALSIIDVDHGTLATLDLHGLEVDNSVYWRPGTTSELIFTSHAGSVDATVAGIFSIRADGGPVTPVIPTVMGPVEFHDVDLAPDGRSLTYWRWQDMKGSSIHWLDIVTGEDRTLRFDPSDTGETGLIHSPDGARVAFKREDSAGQIMVAPADASHPGILVSHRFELDATPAYGFSPDGQTIFVVFAQEEPQFFDAATGASRTGPSTPAECCSWQRLAP